MAEDKIIGGGTLSDFLAKLQERFDTNVVHPDNYMIGKDINNDPKNITNDQGQIVDRDTWDWSKGNPFEKMMQNPAEQGTVRGFLQRMQGGNPTNVGSATEMVAPTSTPNDVNPTPMQQQRQAGLQSTTPTPMPRPDYSQHTALDPNQIEELRKSLLTESGQMDPSNPNGLSGRMNDPNSKADQRSQMNLSENISNDFRKGGVSDTQGPVLRPQKYDNSAPRSMQMQTPVGSPRMMDKIDAMKRAPDKQGVVDAAGIPDIYNKPQTTQGLLDAILSNSEALLPLHGLKDLLVKMGISDPVKFRRAIETNQPIEDKA